MHPMFEKRSIQESPATTAQIICLQEKVTKLWKIIKLGETNYELYCFNGNAIRSSLATKKKKKWFLICHLKKIKLNLDFKESTTNINKFCFFFSWKFDFQLKIYKFWVFFFKYWRKNDEYWPGKIKEEIEWIGEWKGIGANWENLRAGKLN